MELIRYDAACKAIAEAKATDEIKDIRDKSTAMQAYARQAKNKQMEVDAAEIRLRAERRLGEIIIAQKETVGLGQPGVKPELGTGEEPNRRATLADAGIDKKLSARAQKMAAVPAGKFENLITDWRGRVEKENERVTVNLLREGENAAKRTSVTPAAGEYETIVIDPPWPINKIERTVRPSQAMELDYPTMDESEILKFGRTIPAGGDCHLFLWTTQRFLPFSFECLEAWEFRYVCIFVWHKPGGFQPVGLPQYNCEFVVYGRKGTPKFIDTKQFFMCHSWPRREHSRKPDEFYDMIARTTSGPRLDMFAREERAGFDIWGNEV